MEHQPTPERHNEPPKPVFDLEQMTPGQVADLIGAINLAHETWETDSMRTNIDSIGELGMLLEQELRLLPARDIEKAREVYGILSGSSDPWARGFAADGMGEFLRHQPDDYRARQEVIVFWTKLLDDDDEMVRGGAQQSIVDAINSDWLDEPTASYLDSKLPLWRQREWQ